jgi:histidinol phosphatase-like PHP family hydrolase
MKFSSTIHSIVISFALIWSAAAFAQTADLVLTNGKIITVDDQFTTVQALAIKSERIVAIGSDAHYVDRVGRFDNALKLVEEAGIREEQVLNTSTEKIRAYLRGKGKLDRRF